MKFTIVANAPVGSRSVPAFVNGPAFSGLTMVERKEYSDADEERGEELRKLRIKLDLNLGEAARALGIGVAEYSGAEFGRCRIEPMTHVGDTLRAAARKETP